MVEIPATEGRRLTARARLGRLLADPPALAVLALCAAVLGLRRHGAWSHPQFWAEDGYFYLGARVYGLAALWQPYNGYLHTVPRIVAGLADLLDPARVPGFFVGAATLATLYVPARALSRRCPLPRFAGCCALAVVLIPDTREVLLNLVNLQWVLAGGFVLLLLSRDPAGRWETLHDAGAAAALGLTGPFCIVLAPLFAWRALSRGTRASLLLCRIVFACAAVQGLIVVMLPGLDPGSPDDPVQGALLLPAVLERIGGSLLAGAYMPFPVGTGIGTVLGLATLAGIGYLASREGPLRAERILMGFAFAGVLAGSLYRTRHSLPQYLVPHSDSRYVYFPQLMAVWLLLAAAARRGWNGRIAAALAVTALLVNLPRLREAAYADMHWADYAPQIRAGEAVSVPIEPPGWELELPARYK